SPRATPRSLPSVSGDLPRAPTKRGRAVGKAFEANGRGRALSSAQLHVSTHPLVREKLTRLRDESTPPKIFRELVAEIATLLLYEATADLPTDEREVKTPLAPYKGARLKDKVGLVPVLRAGIGMGEAARELMPEAQVWHIGLFRDERTLRPIEYYNE